jgi:hypothetical protein
VTCRSTIRRSDALPEPLDNPELKHTCRLLSSWLAFSCRLADKAESLFVEVTGRALVPVGHCSLAFCCRGSIERTIIFKNQQSIWSGQEQRPPKSRTTAAEDPQQIVMLSELPQAMQEDDGL